MGIRTEAANREWLGSGQTVLQALIASNNALKTMDCSEKNLEAMLLSKKMGIKLKRHRLYSCGTDFFISMWY